MRGMNEGEVVVKIFKIAAQLDVVIDRLYAHRPLQRFRERVADFPVALARFLWRDAIGDALVDAKDEFLRGARDGAVEQQNKQDRE